MEGGLITASDLPNIPEPKDIKELIKTLIDSGVSPTHALWLGNKLQRYIWGFWGERLKAGGLKWQDFLRVFSRLSDDVIEWIRGRVSWESLIIKLRDAIASTAVGVGSGGRPVGLDRWLSFKGAKVK